MTYRCTRARREFETQINDAVRELRVLHSYVMKSNGGVASRLLATYYVFAFAQLEVYVKSFVEDTLTAFGNANPPFNKWPEGMMAYQLHKTEELGGAYRKFGIGEDEGAILTKVAETARKVQTWCSGGATPVILNSLDFLEKKKYPSPKNLPQLFRRLGVPNIWAVISKSGRLNSELLLTSLNDLRTGIAHEGRVPSGFVFRDFLDRISQMHQFVAALDRGMANHFCPAVMHRATWNNAMA